jgi:RND family efflux transporter MFP subunit
MDRSRQPNDSSNGPEAPPPDVSHAGEHSHVPVHYVPGTQRRVALFGGGVAVALAVVFVLGLWSRHRTEAALEQGVREAAEQPAVVNIVHVEPAGAQEILALPGEARSFYETTLFARTSGYVSKWLVDIGDRVTEGQALATIETPELDDQLAEARAKVDQLKAEVHVADTSAAFAKITVGRMEAAAPQGAVSRQEYDQKKSEYDASLAKLEAARAQVALADAEVHRLETLAKFKSVTAPFGGTITQRYVDVGALVTAGSTTNTTPMFTISQADRIRVYVDVPESAAPTIKVGMTVNAEAREYPGKKFVGKVDRTAQSVDPASRTLKVEVLVPNPDLVLLPGMYLQVTFQSSRSHPPLRIPAAALCMRPSGPQVAVVGKDGRVTFRPITIAHDLGDYIEVDSGLTDGEAVAMNVGNGVTDGEIVQAHDMDTPAAPAAAGAAAAKVAVSDGLGGRPAHDVH